MPMRLLFIHRGFPSQFRCFVAGLLARGHRVDAIGAGEPHQLPYGCRYHAYANPETEPLPSGLRDPGLELQLIRAERVSTLARSLAHQGLDPQVVVFHSAWGEGLYLRDIWPRALLVVYPELFGNPSLLDVVDPDAIPLDQGRRDLIERNNLVALSGLSRADAALVPTLFQRDSFPAPWRSRFQVIHEGVDVERIAPDPERRIGLGPGLEFSRNDPVLTFVSRSLEPLRGFGRFMRALPILLERHPRLQVLVVGGGDHSYSPPSTHPAGYRGALLEVLDGAIDLERVHFLGTVSRDQLTSLLQVSTVHAYLSHPYVVSWSLLEAMACGAVVVGSDNAPVRELIRHGFNGLLVPLEEPAAIADCIDGVLSDPDAHGHLGRQARETILLRYRRDQCVTAFCCWIDSLALLHRLP